MLVIRGVAMWIYIPFALLVWPLHAVVTPAARVGPRTYYTWVDEWFIYALTKLFASTRSMSRPHLGHPAAGKTRLTDTV